MASAGPQSPGTLANASGIGTVAWSNAANAAASDNSYATASTTSAGGATSNYLKATNFGFAIPSAATINGIVVSIERKAGGSDLYRVRDEAVLLVKSDGSLSATNKAATLTNWSTSDGTASYGDSADLWGETWSASDINDADFGTVFAATCRTNMGEGTAIAYVDHITITVHYTEGGGGGTISQAVRSMHYFKQGRQ